MAKWSPTSSLDGNTMKMTGGEAVVRSLEANGVQVVFGIPGVHNLAIYDALLDSRIRHITARHEQGAAFMADGYARASGKVGVCLCTSGPALLNAVTPLGTAYADSSPLLCVASQIPSAAIGKEKGYIHECRDQLACLRPVTGWSTRAETIGEIPSSLNEAFQRMTTGRRRPTAVEIPVDVLDGEESVDISPAATPNRLQPSAKQIERTSEMLVAAQRPIIWAGGGVITSGAEAELQQLAEKLQAPVCTTLLGKGSIPEDHPLSFGSALVHPASADFLRTFDVMLAIGTRFKPEDTDNWKLPLPETLIHIDVDPTEHGRNCEPSLAVLGDARETLRAILRKIDGGSTRVASEIASELAQYRQRIVDDCRDLAPNGVALVETLRSSFPRDTIFVSDLTLAAYWCRNLLDLYASRTNIYPRAFCTLGFGLPAAIGSKAACPDQPVVVLSGDGGFMFNLQELSVAIEYDLPIIVLLFNNNAYGVLKPQQQQRYGRSLGADLKHPDFVALSQAFGARSERIETLDQLAPALHRARSSGKTNVLEITADIPLPVMEPATRALHLASLSS